MSRDLCWPDIGQHLISAPGRRRSVQLRRKHCPRTVRQAKQRRCCSLLEHGVLFSLVLVILHQSIVFRCAVFLKTPCSRDTCSPPTTNADLSVCFRDWMVTRTRTASTAGAPFWKGRNGRRRNGWGRRWRSDYYYLGLVDTEKFCFFSILYNFLFWDGRNILVNMTSKWIERSVTPDLHLSSLRYVFGNRPFPVVGLEHNQHKIKAFYPLLDQLVCSASIRLSTAASSMPKKFGSHVWELSICWCMPQQPPRCPKYLGPSTAACTMLFII